MQYRTFFWTSWKHSIMMYVRSAFKLPINTIIHVYTVFADKLSKLTVLSVIYSYRAIDYYWRISRKCSHTCTCTCTSMTTPHDKYHCNDYDQTQQEKKPQISGLFCWCEVFRKAFHFIRSILTINEAITVIDVYVITMIDRCTASVRIICSGLIQNTTIIQLCVIHITTWWVTYWLWHSIWTIFHPASQLVKFIWPVSCIDHGTFSEYWAFTGNNNESLSGIRDREAWFKGKMESINSRAQVVIVCGHVFKIYRGQIINVKWRQFFPCSGTGKIGQYNLYIICSWGYNQ